MLLKYCKCTTIASAGKQNTRGRRELLPMLQSAVRWRHGCCEIDEHHMIILGGKDTDVGEHPLSSGAIYDARTELWTH